MLTRLDDTVRVGPPHSPPPGACCPHPASDSRGCAPSLRVSPLKPRCQLAGSCPGVSGFVFAGRGRGWLPPLFENIESTPVVSGCARRLSRLPP